MYILASRASLRSRVRLPAVPRAAARGGAARGGAARGGAARGRGAAGGFGFRVSGRSFGARARGARGGALCELRRPTRRDAFGRLLFRRLRVLRGFRVGAGGTAAAAERRPVRRRVHGSFADEIGQPIRFGCSQRDTLALWQRGGKATGAGPARRPVAQHALLATPNNRCDSAPRWIGPPATSTFKRAKIAFGRFWQRPRRRASAPQINEWPASPSERSAFRRCPAPRRSRRPSSAGRTAAAASRKHRTAQYS